MTPCSDGPEYEIVEKTQGSRMGEEHLRINRFGFAEYDDMVDIARGVNVPALERLLGSIVDMVFADDGGLLDSLTDEAQADFVVPLGMAARMLASGNFTAMELVSAACTVGYCAAPHLAGFPADLARSTAGLPR